jgi:2-hydroxychromene-2-carboxylate isomerase
MSEQPTITVYSDFKSPYAYLAKDPIYQLEEDFDVRLDWLPYTLDIPSYLGSAKVDQHGEVVESVRNAHQWRRVRYSYMDCRRRARRRGLVILGPRKIWDSSCAGIGLIWAKAHGPDVLRRYQDLVFERFWRRALDIEDTSVVAAVLAEAGAAVDGFAEYLSGEGRREHDAIRDVAEAAGVFGVPSLMLDGELFWGSEHLPDIREMLASVARAPTPIAADR